MDHLAQFILLAAVVIIVIIQMASGALDPVRAWLTRKRRLRRYRQHAPSPDPVQAALDEHVAIDAPNAGIAVAIVTPQGARHWFAGHLDGNLTRAPDADTAFEIGSITKTFTASLLVAMEREGLVDLDIPLDALLPEASRPGRQVPVPVTLESLATHCSGLPRLPWSWRMSAAMYLSPKQPYRFISHAFLERWMRGRRIHHGQRYRYSNLGYGVLGNVLADRAGSTYADVLQRFVLLPLGLGHTRVGGANAKVAQPHTSCGHRVPPWSLRALAPAGGLHSTLNDMTRWLQANLDVRTPLDARLHEPRANSGGRHRSVALGWHVDGEGDMRVVWHNGGTGGSRSLIAFAPARGTGIVMLSNSAASIDAWGLELLRKTNTPDHAEIGLPTRLQHGDNWVA
ncbi:MAG TPA: serine hydrolase domain-containing protein [Rhodanobacteraceae bacterium]|nr:serine hydrolase domain-containing protein [Rhodanobacteraceae bacterium]